MKIRRSGITACPSPIHWRVSDTGARLNQTVGECWNHMLFLKFKETFCINKKKEEQMFTIANVTNVCECLFLQLKNLWRPIYLIKRQNHSTQPVYIIVIQKPNPCG